MHWIDWIIVIVMGYGLITGWMHGLVRTLLNVAALVAAFILGPVLRPFALQIVQLVMSGDPMLKGWFATALSYGAIYLGLSILGIIWSRVLAKGAIKTSDKLAGMALGGALSAIVLAVPLALALSIPILAKAPVVIQTMQQSKFLPIIKPVAPLLVGLAAGWLHPAAAPGPAESVKAPQGKPSVHTPAGKVGKNHP